MSAPTVPPDLGFRLEAFLNWARARILAISNKTGIGDDNGDLPGASGGTDFVPTYETPTVLADQGTGTENAWTTLSSGAPADARYAIVLFEVEATADADQGEFTWRTDSGEAEIPGPIVSGDEDDAQPRLWFFVPLNASGEFDYLMTVGGGGPNWKITRIGYVM